MDVGLDEEVADVLVLQEAAAEVVRQDAGSSHAAGETGEIFELFGDSKGEEQPRRMRATIVEFSESKPDEQLQPQLFLLGSQATPTRNRTRAQTSKASKSSHAPSVKAGRKNQKSSSKQTSFLSCSFNFLGICTNTFFFLVTRASSNQKIYSCCKRRTIGRRNAPEGHGA